MTCLEVLRQLGLGGPGLQHHLEEIACCLDSEEPYELRSRQG